MKIKLKGKVSLRGNVRTGSKCSSSSNISRLRRAIRREVRSGVNEIRRALRAQRQAIRRDFNQVLFSTRFANFIREAIASDSQFREIFLGLLNQNVEVSTTAGNVTGTVIEVGNNYVVLRETASTILVIPFSAVNNVQPL